MHGRTIHCIIPGGTDPAVVDAIRSHYADRPDIRVIVDRRGRRTQSAHPERRRPVVRRRAVDLPPEASAEAGDVRMVEHLPPLDTRLADEPTAVVADLAEEGDTVAAAELRWRMCETVRTRLEFRLRSPSAAEVELDFVIDIVLDSIGGWHRQTDFHAWVSAVADAAPLSELAA